MPSKRGVGRPRVDLSDLDAARLAGWLAERFRRAEGLRKKKGIGAARPLYNVRTGEMVRYLVEEKKRVRKKKGQKKNDEKKAYKCIEAVALAGIIRRKLEPPKGSRLRRPYFRGQLPTVNRADGIVVPIVGRQSRGWWVVRDWYSVPVGPRGLPLDVDVNVPRPLSEERYAAIKWTLPQELGRNFDRWLRGPAAGALRALHLGIRMKVDIEWLPVAPRDRV